MRVIRGVWSVRPTHVPGKQSSRSLVEAKADRVTKRVKVFAVVYKHVFEIKIWWSLV